MRRKNSDRETNQKDGKTHHVARKEEPVMHIHPKNVADELNTSRLVKY